jgi:hypothetical protein
LIDGSIGMYYWMMFDGIDIEHGIQMEGLSGIVLSADTHTQR